MTTFDQTPDDPDSFGYKVSWFAVKTFDSAAVLDAIGAEGATPANWESGLGTVHYHSAPRDPDRWIFVSPSVGGWVLAVSTYLPHPDTVETKYETGRRFDQLFSRLMKRFDDVQYFGSHRVSDFAAWARAVNGQPVRIFSYAGSEGQVFANFGAQTQEEAKLRLPDLTGLSPLDATERMFAIAEEGEQEESRLVAGGLSPDEAREHVAECSIKPFPSETDVTDLAGLWSIDPTDLPEQDDPSGVGWAAHLPENLTE